MAERYYYAQGETESGPFTANQMRERAATGRIGPTDAVWKEGTTQRIEAGRVKNLFAAPDASGGGDPAPAPTPPSGPDPVAADAGLASAPAPVAVAEIPAAETADPPAEADQPAPAPVAPPAPARPRNEPPKREKRVVAIKGGIVASQDGVTVRFRKKCTKCGYEDQARTSAVIRIGSTRISFFCPKCRKARQVELTGIG